MADDENFDLLVQLRDKTEELRMWYQNIYKDRPEDPGSIVISPYEKKMLDSCYRWHINSHIRLDIFRTKSSLKSYFLKDEVRFPYQMGFFYCCICRKDSIVKYSLTKHIKNHTPTEVNRCQLCGKTQNNVMNRNMH